MFKSKGRPAGRPYGLLETRKSIEKLGEKSKTIKCACKITGSKYGIIVNI